MIPQSAIPKKILNCTLKQEQVGLDKLKYAVWHAGASKNQNVPSPLQVLKAITAVPDDTPGISVSKDASDEFGDQNPSEFLKPIEIRPRAMALMPLAVVGAFGQNKLLEPSCRGHTLINACTMLTRTSQRVDVLLSVLCALCSKSSVLRTHACNTAAALLKACEKESNDPLEQGVACIATEIISARKALEHSRDALQNVLSTSKATGMQVLLLHAICPTCTSSSDDNDGQIEIIPPPNCTGPVPGVATSAVRSCMTALASHGPHALRTLFKILCQHVGDAAAVVATHAYVPCILKHTVPLLEEGMPASGLMGLALDVLRSFQKLPDGAVHAHVPESVSKRMAAMHGAEAFVFCPGEVLRSALDARAAPKAVGVPLMVSQNANDITTSVRCVN